MTQREIVLDHMERFGTITRAQAFDVYGITELNTRIHELRKEGYIITSQYQSGYNRFGKKTGWYVYSLAVDE